MNFENIVIFTKTLWEEPPRLRHQIAKLFQENGHSITFFEKTDVKNFRTLTYKKNNTSIVRHYELLHHQLKPFQVLVYLNSYILKKIISSNIDINDVDLIINFNYDYDF